MDPADQLLDKIFSLADLEERSADELNELAAALEKQRKSVNVSQVAGSAVSAVGSAALLTAGLCTGGAAVPVLALGGKAVSWLGLSINLGSEVVDGINPKIDKKEKKIDEKIDNLTEEIQTLTESLADEGKEAGVPEDAQDEYVTGRILEAMAKRHGLILDTKISQGAFGLVFSGAELIYTCATLNNCETEKSKSLRKRAKEMKTHAEKIKEELDAVKRMLKELAEVKNSIESKERSPEQKKKLIEYAKKECKDEAVKAWLEENEKSEAFFDLVTMFQFLKGKIDEEQEKIDRENIDIIFVAHGEIKNPPIPARCLLPLPTIQDVVLYSPWNCALHADPAYGIATGRLKPVHRVFFCGGESCEVKHEGHQPTKLPGVWNSMKDAGEREQMIPTISVSPLGPEDGAWKRIEFLQDQYGPPGKNRILIPFILPGVSDDFEVPFFVITLALSLVLLFSPYKATVHLAACLGRSETISDLFEHDLNHQYSYTIDETAMTSSKKMLDGTPLSKLFKDLFG